MTYFNFWRASRQFIIYEIDSKRRKTMGISAIDENGNPVDWWFMYKVSGESTTSDGRKVLGTEYIYFDANTPADGKAVLSPYKVDKDGALPNTLARIYETGNQNLGWFCYNDENPITGQVV